MDFPGLVLAILAGSLPAIPLAIATVAWEIHLHRRTIRETARRTDSIEAKVDATVAKADRDRAAILDAIESRTTERIQAARAQMDEQVAAARREIEEREATIAVTIQREREALHASIAEREAAINAAAEELARKEEMARRGMIGNEKKAEKAAAIDALKTEIESRFGAKALQLAEENMPQALETAAKWRGTVVGQMALQQIEKALGGGTVPEGRVTAVKGWK